MTITQEDNDIIIRLDASLIDIKDIQRFADYFRMLESNAKNKGTDEQVEELVRDSHKHWLEINKDRLADL